MVEASECTESTGPEVAELSPSSRFLSYPYILVVRLVSMLPMLDTMFRRDGYPASSVNISEYTGSDCFFFPFVFLAVEATFLVISQSIFVRL